MTADITRRTFRPDNHYRSVQMQQGRVQLDADWNEQADIQAYREQTANSAIVGAAGVPWHDGDRGGFAIRTGVVERSLHGVALASANVAVAVGGDATILRTTNGGVSWTRQQMSGSPPSVPPPATVLRAAGFASPTEGLVAGDGSTVLHTADGGATWSRIEVPAGLTEDLFAVHLMPGRRRWVVAGAGGTILSTDNAGQTWVSRSTGVTGTLRGVSFAADENAGVAVGDNATIITTDDGGVTWRPRAAPAAVGETLHAVDVRGRQIVAVGDNATVITSDDAGVTWTLITRLAEAPRTLHAVRNVSAERWIAVGGDRTVVSNDSAATWTPGFIGDEITATARGVDFLPGGRGILVGDGHPARGDEPAAVTTSDGGVGWSELTQMPSELLVTAGTMYVNGILCENARDLPLQQQPDLPAMALPTVPGDYVFYLDVWDQQVSALQRPQMREVALGGADTTTRVRTVWQVRAESLAQWSNPADLAPTGRLAARSLPEPGAPEPCLIPGGAGYRGLENRCYRIQVVDAAVPTLAWSRDNGSVAARVLRRDDRVLTVSTLGREVREAFSEAAFVELTDEARVLSGQAGVLVALEKAEGDQLVLRPGTALPDLDPATAVVRRWDGLISPATPQTWHTVEEGVQIRLTTGTYRVGDHWAVAARTGTGDVEWPQDAGQPRFEPPQGIQHHYAELARWRLDSGGWSSLSDERPMAVPLSRLTGLSYLGGDGLEYQPSPASVVPISVGVPVRGAVVRFIPQSGRVRDATNSPLASFVDVVAYDRVARCQWLPDDTANSTSDKRIVAHLVRSFRTDPFPGIDTDTERNRIGHPIAFTARPFGGTAVTDVREQLYTGLAAGIGDGIGYSPGEPDFGFSFAGNDGLSNNFQLTGGRLIAGGRPAGLPDAIFVYSQQPWTDPAKAAADGVPVIAPLTTPSADRTDLVYADVWDGANRREIAVRVQEGNSTGFPPLASVGHVHLTLARFHRPAGAARIEYHHVEDRRPQFNQARRKLLRLAPIFHPMVDDARWGFEFTTQGFAARKSAQGAATGAFPLSLPEGALLSSLRVSGTTTGGSATQGVTVQLFKTVPNLLQTVVVSELVTTKGAWSRTLTLPQKLRLDAQFFACFIAVSAFPGPAVDIYELTVEYDY